MNSADSLLAPMEDTTLEQAPLHQAPNKETNVTDQIIQDRPREINKELNNSNVTPLSAANKNLSLRDCVAQSMENYFHHLDGQPVSDVYDMVLAEVEAPLLEIVMKYTRHNQTQASQVLGLNRGTLRKKLKQHGLI